MFIRSLSAYCNRIFKQIWLARLNVINYQPNELH